MDATTEMEIHQLILSIEETVVSLNNISADMLDTLRAILSSQQAATVVLREIKSELSYLRR
jgi:hypothetical protein